MFPNVQCVYYVLDKQALLQSGACRSQQGEVEHEAANVCVDVDVARKQGGEYQANKKQEEEEEKKEEFVGWLQEGL